MPGCHGPLAGARAGVVAALDGHGVPQVFDVATVIPRWRAALEADAGAALRAAAAEALAATSRDGATACLADAGGLALWSVEDDRAIAAVPGPLPERILAQSGACLAIGEGGLRRLGRDGSVRTLVPDEVGAVQVDGDETLVVSGDRLRVFGADGTEGQGAPVPPRVTAVARSGQTLVVGFADGSISEIGRDGPSLADTPASQVVAVALGPVGTIVAGHGGGEVGIWSAATGARLDAAYVAGSVTRLEVVGATVRAVGQRGGRVERDLAFASAPRCAILREVWAEVPIVWEGGAAVRRGVPAGHPCAPTVVAGTR
jgi:hypothetical protein